jgi:fermentation-respiration switch protein FrsA (DUF1100 family)
MENLLLSFLILLASLITLLGLVRLLFRRIIEWKLFENDRVVDKLPSDFNLDYEEIWIEVRSRELHAWLIKAPLINQEKSAILIYHGGGETISWWLDVQKYLYDRGISSMVFDYSAYGQSTGRAKLGNLKEDAVAAYEIFDRKIGNETHKYVLGFSMGAAVLLEAYPVLGDSLGGIVLAHPFSSMRDLVVGLGVISRRLEFLVPDILHNETNVKRVNKPLLAISSEADKITPPSQAREVFNSANDPKELIIHLEVTHNDLWENPTDDYWLPILRFIEKVNHLQ